MRYILLTWLLMLAACTNCRSACLPVAECHLASLTTCINRCERAGIKAPKIGRSAEYKQWRQCLQNMDRSSQRSCNTSYFQCQRAIAGELFQ